MFICGNNEFSQLDKYSNNRNSNGKRIIKPPVEFHVDPSTISSFSTSLN